MSQTTTTTLSPMLCLAVDKVPTGPGWGAQYKWDGWHLMVEMTARGLRMVGGRNNGNYTGQLPYLADAFTKGNLPVGTILAGEITGKQVGGWNQVQSVMTNGRPHRPTDASPALTYVVFDILQLGDTDLRQNPYSERHATLSGLAGTPHVQVSDMFAPSEDALKAALAAGFEGLVCRRLDSPYIPGKSHACVKIKPQQTSEAIIRGFKPGKPGRQWDGKVGAFIVEMLDDKTGEPTGAMTSVKCGTNARHIDATEHPERWLGQIIEVKHFGLGNDGVPRSPQYLRRRDDRTPTTPARQRVVSSAPPTGRTAMSFTPGQPSRRNYRQMGEEKLYKSIASLRAREGEAFEKCKAGNGDPDADLAVAVRVCRDKGYAVPA